MWTPRTLDAGVPVYRAIADALAQDLHEGRLAPGDRLPPHRDLARELGINVVTVTRGYAEAARRGLVEGEVGRGTFVRPRAPRAPTTQPHEIDDPGLVDFMVNVPHVDPELLEIDSVVAAATGAAATLLLSGYRPAGLADHRAAGAEWVERSGLTVDADRVLVCSGAQHALTVALATLTTQGDLILTEQLSYPGIKSIASVLGLRLQGIAIDRSGLCPDAFESVCRRSNPKVLYCMPTLQNPTGTILPEDRRREIAAVARKYGVAILEDDTYTFLATDPPPPLVDLAPELGYFVTGTSKSIASGLRVGYLCAPAGPDSAVSVERLSANLAAITWMSPPLMAEIATAWIRGGQADRAIAFKRREIAARRKLFDRRLGAIPTDSQPASAHVWLQLPAPWRSADFTAQARQNGVALTPAEAFVVDRATAPHAVRICIGTPPAREHVDRAVRALGCMLEGMPDCCSSIV